eukprot:CAMPEP_0184752620 /NCGR_PEP_ID=MMETSP0315-20130426/43670_1 /TAXON_ID=101924 /ORGANISM="Rhodosorus marinus, Strain UTEX LB 2760" /LENGTH=863 /DNA_ID=CAMNT_0027231961 /DNA_START=514 /DNA_END=3105 /DNA_ORIENTATION=+
MWRNQSSAVIDADKAPPRKTYPQAASGYDLKEQIGQGSAATVFKAWCEQEHEEVAIKVIDLEWFQASLDDIWKEIQVMSLSSHPNVVPYSTSFVDGTDLWVVMPLLTGGSVQSLLNGLFPGGMPEPLTQYLLFETVKALDYFHKHGQIHRDVQSLLNGLFPGGEHECNFLITREISFHFEFLMPLTSGTTGNRPFPPHKKIGMPEPLTQYLLFETVKALDYFHKHGQIHRDVKAANILLTSQGQVMLSDYGVMGWMVEGGVERKAAQTVVGSPNWMAPEVLEQRHGYNYRADIWSLGITALELAQGHPPYMNYPPVKILMTTLNDPPPQLTGQPSFEYSKAFKEMLQLCLQKDPKRRASTSDLLQHRFFRNVKKPDDLPELLSRLPPLGSRAGSQAMLYRLLRKGKKVGSRGASESQSKSLVWDFGSGDEAESGRFYEVESTATKSSTDTLSKPITSAPIPPPSPLATPKPPSRVGSGALASSPAGSLPKRVEEKAGDGGQSKSGAIASTSSDASTVPEDTTKFRKSRFTISEVELSKTARGETQDAEEHLRANASDPLLDATDGERNSSRRSRIQVKEVLKDDPSIVAPGGPGLVGENVSTHSGGNVGPNAPVVRSLASQDNLASNNLPKVEGDTDTSRHISRKPSRFEVTAIGAAKEAGREKPQEAILEPVSAKSEGTESHVPPAHALGEKEPTKMSRKQSRFEIMTPVDGKESAKEVVKETVTRTKETATVKEGSDGLARKPSRFQITDSGNEAKGRAARPLPEVGETSVPTVPPAALRSATPSPSNQTPKARFDAGAKPALEASPVLGGAPKRKGRFEVLSPKQNPLEMLKSVMEQVEMLMKENENLKKELAALKRDAS